MKKVAILLANGFEEIEALTPKDVLSRAGMDCKLISINNDICATGAHNVLVNADETLENNSLNDYDMVVLPGGMPGAKYLSQDERVMNILKQFNLCGKYIAAICASPALVLSRANVIEGKSFTCYPGMEGYVMNANYIEDSVVQDGNIITSRGPATAFDLAFKIVEVLGGDSKTLKEGMLYN